MDNHFHLLVKTYPEKMIEDEKVCESFEKYYKGQRELLKGQISYFKHKWSNLSEFVKELKQRFTRYFNKKHNRKGYFWADRFKSVIVEKGETLINCAAYIDLNPIRAGIVEKPEDYRWSSIGYIFGTGDRDNFIKLEFDFNESLTEDEKFLYYRKFVYEIGSMDLDKGAVIKPEVIDREEQKGFEITKTDRMLKRTRYFTEGVFLGSREFVKKNFHRFKDKLKIKKDKNPVKIKGFDKIFSFRFTEG